MQLTVAAASFVDVVRTSSRWYGSPIRAHADCAEVTVSAGTIPAGAAVACLIGAAGRDPAWFREPDRFDVMRDDAGQLTLGPGDCPAVQLAALEAEYGLRALMDAMPGLRRADGYRPAAATGLLTRSPRTLLVRPCG